MKPSSVSTLCDNINVKTCAFNIVLNKSIITKFVKFFYYVSLSVLETFASSL